MCPWSRPPASLSCRREPQGRGLQVSAPCSWPGPPARAPGHRAREGSGSQPCRGSRTSLLRREPRRAFADANPSVSLPCLTSSDDEDDPPGLWKLSESNRRPRRGAGPAHLSSQLPTALPGPLGAFIPRPGTCPRTFALVLSRHGFPQIRPGSPQLGPRGTPPPRGLPGLRSFHSCPPSPCAVLGFGHLRSNQRPLK